MPTTTKVSTALLGLAALLVGCHQTGDGYDARFLLEADRAAVDFGAVTLPATSAVETLTLRNTGRKTIRLAAVSSASLGVDTPTFELHPSASTCTTGAELQPGQACTLAFTFSPERNTPYRDDITVSWTSVRDDANREETFTRTLVLRGEGDLDCDAEPAWRDAYGVGKDEALTQNTADYDRGYAAGQAKDYDDGYRGAYDRAYESAHEEAYVYAYDRAYDSFYDQGYDEGWAVHADTWRACDAGGADGWADGSAIGSEDGAVVGHDDGLYDGAADANYQAWELLDDAERWGGVVAACEEAWAWFGGASLPPPPSDPTDEEIAGMCEELGFSENRDSSALDDGYKAGLRDNVEYQAGLREGAADGTSQGTVDGTRSGNRDGRQDGLDDGAADGKADAEQLAYEDCYDAAYPAAYAEAFDLAYLDAYWLAYDQAYVDEYDAVMVDYYETQDCEVVLFGG